MRRAARFYARAAPLGPDDWPLAAGRAASATLVEVRVSRGNGSPGRAAADGLRGEPTVHVGDGGGAVRRRRHGRRALADRPAPRRRSTTRRCGATSRSATPARCSACWRRRRLPAWPLHILVSAGVSAVTRAAYYSGDPAASTPCSTSGSASTRCSSSPARWRCSTWRDRRRLRVAAARARRLPAAGALDHDDRHDRARRLHDRLAGRAGCAGSARESAALARERAELIGDARRGRPHRRPHRAAQPPRLGRGARARAGPGGARRRRRSASALADLDRFKLYNDDHGHQAGDRLLKEIAAAWRSELRTTDVLARYGGEEFALALPGCDIGDASGAGRAPAAATPEEQTCSVGLVLWDGEETAERLFGRADKALYAAKEAGRDRIVSA